MSPRRVRIAVAATIAAAVFGPMMAALAYWTVAGGGDAATRADVLDGGNQPSASAVAHRITLSWVPSALAEHDEVSPDAYDVYRYSADPAAEGGTDLESRALAGDCVRLVFITTCTIDDSEAGTYRFGIVPRLAEWAGAESELSEPLTIAPPAITGPDRTSVTVAQPTIDGLLLTGFRDEEPVELRLEPVGEGASFALVTVTTDEVGDAGLPPTPLPADVIDGTYTIVAVGEISGEVGPTHEVLIDRVAPVAIAPSVPAWSTDDVIVTLAGSDAAPGALAGFEYQLGDGDVVPRPVDDPDVPVSATADLTVVAIDAAGNRSAPRTVTVHIDRAAPMAGLRTTGAFVNRSVVLTNAATDTGGSGVASVQFFWCPTASCTVPTPIAPADTTAPYTAAWPDQPVDGPYVLSVNIVDVAGNVADATLGPVTVDNTGPTLVVNPLLPIIGASVPLSASATDAAGVAAVVFEYATSPTGPWTLIGSAAASPADTYTATWNTVGLDPVTYLVRATATDVLANPATQAISNTAILYGPTSVTLLNRAGGTPGRMEKGDQIVITWNRPPTANTLCGKWSQLALPLALNGLTVRVVDVPGGADRLDILVVCNNGSNGNFGSIILGGDYTDAAGVEFGGTGNGLVNGQVEYNPLSMTITLTLGNASTTGTRKTVAVPGPARYIPSPGAVFGDVVPASRPKTSTNF